MTNADDPSGWSMVLVDLLVRLIAYFGILVLIAVVVFFIMKYVAGIHEQATADQEITATETNPIQPQEAKAFTYGTCFVESGNYSASISCSGSSDELYDGKLCVICYDEERNSFFVPCGHCATCYVCATRIFNRENKVCPVCRRLIRKVRKFFAA